MRLLLLRHYRRIVAILVIVTIHHTNIYANAFGKSEFPDLPTDPQQIFTAHSGLALTAIVFSPRCDYLVSVAKDQISRWDKATDNKWSANWSIKDKTGELITTLAISSDEAAVAFGTYNGHVQILDPATGGLQRSLVAQNPEQILRSDDNAFEENIKGEWVTAIAFCPNNPLELVVSTLTGSIFLWDIITGQLIRTFQGHTDSVTALAFYQNGRQLVSGSWDGTIRIWDLQLGQEDLPKLLTDQQRVNSISISADRLIASGPGASILTWDLSVSPPQITHISNSRVSTGGRLAFSPNSDYFFAQMLEAVYVWSIEEKTFKRFGSIRKLGVSDIYQSLAIGFNWQEDLFYLALGTVNGRLVIWDMRQAVEPAAFE